MTLKMRGISTKHQSMEIILLNVMSHEENKSSGVNLKYIICSTLYYNIISVYYIASLSYIENYSH